MVKNDNKYKTRPSPPFSATLFPNEIKEGNDKEDYISKKDKNGIYKWYKISLKKNPEEYYKQFPNYIKPKYNINIFTQNFKNLLKDLKKINVIFYFIKWNVYGDESFEYEYFGEDNKLSDNYLLYSERSLFWNSRNKDGIMYITHNITKNLWSSVNKLLTLYFPNRTNGIENNKDALKIYFEEKKKINKENDKISISLDIFFEKKDFAKNEDAIKYFKIIDSLVKKKKIGYLSEASYTIRNGKTYAYFNIDKNKLDDFKIIIKKIENNELDIPKVKKVLYNILED
jgi:hypothetical protein